MTDVTLNVTKVPTQIVVDDALIFTLPGEEGSTVIVLGIDVAD